MISDGDGIVRVGPSHPLPRGTATGAFLVGLALGTALGFLLMVLIAGVAARNGCWC